MLQWFLAGNRSGTGRSCGSSVRHQLSVPPKRWTVLVAQLSALMRQKSMEPDRKAECQRKTAANVM